MKDKWVYDGDWSIEQSEGQPFKDVVNCDGETLFSVPDTYSDVSINTMVMIANQAFAEGVGVGKRRVRFLIQQAIGI